MGKSYLTLVLNLQFHTVTQCLLINARNGESTCRERRGPSLRHLYNLLLLYNIRSGMGMLPISLQSECRAIDPVVHLGNRLLESLPSNWWFRLVCVQIQSESSVSRWIIEPVAWHCFAGNIPVPPSIIYMLFDLKFTLKRYEGYGAYVQSCLLCD